MQIRHYTDNDLESLRAIHAAQGFAYALPDLRNPLFLTKIVLTNGTNAEHAVAGSADLLIGEGSSSANAQQGSTPSQIIGAAFLRLTAEAYLLLDPQHGTPQDRWRALLHLHAAAERDAWHRGLEDVHAWLPPPIAQKFGKRIAKLGWLRDDVWTPYCRKLIAPPQP
jgi:hypothetical protein